MQKLRVLKLVHVYYYNQCIIMSTHRTQIAICSWHASSVMIYVWPVW